MLLITMACFFAMKVIFAPCGKGKGWWFVVLQRVHQAVGTMNWCIWDRARGPSAFPGTHTRALGFNRNRCIRQRLLQEICERFWPPLCLACFPMSEKTQRRMLVCMKIFVIQHQIHTCICSIKPCNDHAQG